MVSIFRLERRTYAFGHSSSEIARHNWDSAFRFEEFPADGGMMPALFTSNGSGTFPLLVEDF
uniref:hypothetical protein n=1 Tax=Paenibacillus pabuli TaxID=1472 RepID=UPI0015EC0061|nr:MULTISPECIES: hypothetical protein [Paenibacillus]